MKRSLLALPLAILLCGLFCRLLPFAGPGARAAAERDSSILMKDVTTAAGIHFTHYHGGSGRHYYVETMSGGAAFLDYDGDGWSDILLVQSAPLPGSDKTGPFLSALYHNNHDGTFTDVTRGSGLDVQMYGMGAAVGDFDNDGRPDLYITSLNGNHLYHNEGNGKFRDVTKGAGVASKDFSTSAAWLDYDNDGKLDLFVCRYMDYEVATNPRCKDERGRPAYCSPSVYKRTHCALFRNRGDGTFENVTVKSGIGKYIGRSVGVTTADFNGDSRVDIFVTNDMSPNYLLINQGNGTFRDDAAMSGVAYGENGVAYAGMGTDCGDIRNDGRMGLVVTNFEHEPVTVYSNDGSGLFRDESGISGVSEATKPFLKWGCKLVDLDLDGHADLFIVNGHVDDHEDERKKPLGYAQPSQVLLNHGNGTFSDISKSCGRFFERKQVARAVAFGDFNNDGAIDALIGVNNGPAVLLRNDSPRRNNWVRIALEGSARPGHMGCNRDALGARIRVTAGSLPQTQVVRSGSSYLADHDRRALFGLGIQKEAAVEIRWPCGAVETRSAKAGETVTVSEQGCRLGDHRDASGGTR